MKKLTLMFVLLGMCFAQAGMAGTVSGLYRMEVPVVDREVESRTEGLVTALRLVLVRLTGDRNAGNTTGVGALFKNAQSYVQQYRYVKHEDKPEQLNLWVQFDPVSLERDIRQLGLPVWGSTRPTALVWLAVENAGLRSFVQADSELGRLLQRQFERRGIPLLFPLLDAEDNASLRPDDLLLPNNQLVIDASRRYGAEAIISGVLKQGQTGLWEASWRLIVDQEVQTWRTEADVPGLMIEEGTDGVADSLAARFASSSLFGKSGWLLLVDNMTSVDDYARVQHYLASLDVVTRVEVRQLDRQSASFYVEAHGGAQTVSQTIALGRILQPVTEQLFHLMPRVVEH